MGFPDGERAIMPRAEDFSYRVRGPRNGDTTANSDRPISRPVALPGQLVETRLPVVPPPDRTPTPMRICIFGAGAVGSHFAVRLALAGHDVSCVMRGPHLDAVKAKGLTLRVGDAEFPARGQGIRRPGGARSAGSCHLNAEGDRRRQPRRPACRRCWATTPPSCSPRTAFPGGTTSGLPSDHPPPPDLGFLDPGGALRSARFPGADHRRRDLFVERGRRARHRRQSLPRPEHAAGRRMRRPRQRADRTAARRARARLRSHRRRSRRSGRRSGPSS